jgi:hypothetical protein
MAGHGLDTRISELCVVSEKSISYISSLVFFALKKRDVFVLRGAYVFCETKHAEISVSQRLCRSVRNINPMDK